MDSWETGTADALPALEVSLLAAPADPARVSPDIEEILSAPVVHKGWTKKTSYVCSRAGADFARVCQQATRCEKWSTATMSATW